MSEQEHFKRFCISRPATRPLCIVEAQDEQEAISRAQLIIEEARHLHVPAGFEEMLVVEMHEKQPNLLPFYKDGYFQLIELRDAKTH